LKVDQVFSNSKQRTQRCVNLISLCFQSQCSNTECQSKLNATENINKGKTLLVETDFKNDLIDILEHNWKEIQEYKILLKQSLTSDICNTQSYLKKDLALNKIAFILFIDAAPFSTTFNGSVWSIFGYIANLPPRLRARLYNILKILFISGRLFSLNRIFDNKMENLKYMLKDGIEI
jgi:hypothetical protein